MTANEVSVRSECILKSSRPTPEKARKEGTLKFTTAVNPSLCEASYVGDINVYTPEMAAESWVQRNFLIFFPRLCFHLQMYVQLSDSTHVHVKKSNAQGKS